MKSLLITGFAALVFTTAQAQQYKVITVLESMANSAATYSKIVDTAESLNATEGYTEHAGTTEVAANQMRPSPEREAQQQRDPAASREDRAKASKEAIPEKSGRKASKKVEKFNEVGLHNLGANVGINPHHVSSNDAVVSAKITQMAQTGWTLSNVTTAIDGEGANRMIVTKLFFFKAKK